MTKEEYLSMYNIIGAAMEVHRQLGRGLDELIYHEALTMELTSNNILVENEKKSSIFYKGKKMKKHYFADMYYHGLIIELKSTSSIISDHRAQLMNYMRISHTNRGLLLNFGEKKLHTERYLYLPKEDDFILLNKDNYKEYVED